MRLFAMRILFNRNAGIIFIISIFRFIESLCCQSSACRRPKIHGVKIAVSAICPRSFPLVCKNTGPINRKIQCNEEEGIGTEPTMFDSRDIWRKYFAYTPTFNAAQCMNIHCGEIVSGKSIRYNEDGSISVDIGCPQELVVSRESMTFLSHSEKIRLDRVIEFFKNSGSSTKDTKTTEELTRETIFAAKSIPDRRRKSYLRPEFHYATDFHRLKHYRSHAISYDLDFSGEIQPRRLSVPNVTGDRVWKDYMGDERMEFIVTNINPYSDKLYGEVFSEGIVESKRRIYLAMLMEATDPIRKFYSYDAIIHEKFDGLLKVKLLDGRFSNISGLNAFAVSNKEDKVGDRIKVYLGGSDSALEHLYLFRKQITNQLLRKEGLKALFDEIMNYYVNSGTWFKVELETIEDDSLLVRILGQDNEKHLGYVQMDQLPYSCPEGVLNETFRRSNLPNQHFINADIEINVGKLNYSIHYDKSLYVRVYEYEQVDRQSTKMANSDKPPILNVFLTTKPLYKPNDTMLALFNRLVAQKAEYTQDLKTGISYPCLLVGEASGFIYFAINYKFKPKFTMEDDYFVGIMEVGQYSKNLPFGKFVHARISSISYNDIERSYMVGSTTEGSKKYEYSTVANWFWNNNPHKCQQVSDGFSSFGAENTKLCLIWMDDLIIPKLDSPNFAKFLPLQPIIAESEIFEYVEDALSPYSIHEKSPKTFEPLAPQSITEFFVDSFNKLTNESKKDVTEDIGTQCIKYNDDPDDIIAPPAFYLYNREMREIYIKNMLDPGSFSTYRKIIESSTTDTYSIATEFFCDPQGKGFYQFLEKLKNPKTRRNIKVKETLSFEREVKFFLSGYQDLYIDNIYKLGEKENLVFASIVPRSLRDITLLQIKEIEDYLSHVRYDFLMDKVVRKSIQRILRILSHPNNSFMAQLRNRHRKIPTDVFFYSEKSLNYDSYEDIERPIQNLYDDDENELSTEPEDCDEVYSQMMPFPNIIREPSLFGAQLESCNMAPIRKIYNNLLSAAGRTQPKHGTAIGLGDEGINCEDLLTDSDFDDPNLTEYCEEEKDIVGNALNEIGNARYGKDNLRLTPRDWRRLNKFPLTTTKEDVRQFIRDTKKYRPIHGLKLPVL